MGVHEKLWCSVILQSMADVEEGERIAYYEKHDRKKLSQSSVVKRGDIADYSKGARDWFDCGDTCRGSFRWICDMCDLDADRIWELSLTRTGRQMFLKAAPKDKDRPNEEEEE